MMKKQTALKYCVILTGLLIGGLLAMNTGIAKNLVEQGAEKPRTAIKAPPVRQNVKQDRITIRTQAGKDLKFNVELAITPQEQAAGLMFRTFMAEDSGMLFLFNNVAQRSFWMKNTLIPLDILFITRDGEIHHIHHRAKPQDLTKITSTRPSYAVLELKGGMAETLGLTEGDTILYPAFRNIVAE